MSDHPSRQDLVIPPRGSSLPVVLGAILCGCAGFGLVIFTGLGRSRPMEGLHSLQPAAEGPGREASTGDARRAVAQEPAEPDGWYPTRPASFETAEPAFETREIRRTSAFADSPAGADLPVRGGDLEPEQPGEALEAPEGGPQPDTPAAETQRLSRFSTLPAPLAVADSAEPLDPVSLPTTEVSPEPLPAAVSPAPAPVTERAAEVQDEPAAAVSEETISTPIGTASQAAQDRVAEIAEPPAPRPTDITQQPELPAAAPPVLPPADIDAPAGKPEPPSAEKTDSPPAAEVPPATGTEAVETRSPSNPFDPRPVVNPAVPLAAPEAKETALGIAPAGRTPVFVPPRQAVPVEAAASGPPAPGPFAGADAALPAAAAVPFAAAPGLDAGLPRARPAGPATPVAATFNAMSGQGQPGPPQLEGLQTPQLTVEKSGPREVQVGKATRFEISVKNVGSATARDTLLQDAVPAGATLIATTPPASPATDGASGQLQWAIGTLQPGQEARVAIDLMPEVEGELGSVASVSFRTDASVRSRVTKPGLVIEPGPLEPVLMGKELTVDLTVSNPGSGTATGVVVEAVLPEAVSHPAGREVEFDVGQLSPGESRRISLVLATRSPGVHPLSLGARADGGLEVERSAEIEVTAPMLTLEADIPSRRYLQRPAVCSLAITNTGTAPALAVELAAQLPPGVKFVRANNAGFYDERTRRVLWSLEELPAGETGTVELVLMPTALGPQPVTAAVRNPAGLSDQLTHTIDVEGLAALSFEVVDSEDPIEVGGVTEYVVRVTNEGTKAATGVRLAATLLGDLEPVDAKGPVPWRVENLQFIFDPLATLAPAEETVFRIRARGRREGNQRVQIQLSSQGQQAALTAEEVTHVYADR